MADVRLTAINPEDSSVVPVACNDKGELKLEEIPSFDGNVDGDLTVSGSASFAGSIDAGASDLDAYGLFIQNNKSSRATIISKNFGNGNVFEGRNPSNEGTIFLNSNGNGTFGGTVTSGPVELNSANAFTIYKADGASGIIMTNAGNASFDGNVQSGGNVNNGVNIGATLAGPEGVVVACGKPAGSTFIGYSQGTTAPTATIGSAGSATFAGGKCGFTSAGELFVTVRGKKYKTISVANGIMSWEEMTLRGQVQERLDDVKVQIDPNFGVSPEKVQIDPNFGVSPETDTAR